MCNYFSYYYLIISSKMVYTLSFEFYIQIHIHLFIFILLQFFWVQRFFFTLRFCVVFYYGFYSPMMEHFLYFFNVYSYLFFVYFHSKSVSQYSYFLLKFSFHIILKCVSLLLYFFPCRIWFFFKYWTQQHLNFKIFIAIFIL